MSIPNKPQASPGKRSRRPILPWLIAGLMALPLSLALAGFLILESLDFGQLKSGLSQAVRQATGYELVLAGPLELKISLHPSLLLEQVALNDPARGGEPALASARRVEVEVELWPLLSRRQLVVRRLGLEGLALLIETGAPAGRGLASLLPDLAAPANSKPGGGQAQEAGGLAWFHFQHVQVSQARLDWRRPGEPPLVLTLQTLEMHQERQDAPVSLAAQGNMGKEPFSLQGQVQAPGQAGRPWPLQATLNYAGLEAKVEGKVQNLLAGQGLDLQVRCQVPRPAQLGLPPWPGPWRLSGRLSDPRPQTLRLEDLVLEGPAGRLQGQAEVAWPEKRLRIGADLEAQNLDLSPWWGLGEADGTPAAAGLGQEGRRPGRVFSSAPLDLAGLNQADLELRLKAQTLKMPRLDLEQVDLRLELNQGTLSLNPLEARLAGGPASLRLTLAPRGGQALARADLSLRGCQIGQVLRRAGAEEMLTGSLEGQLEARGQGASLAGIMASLEGKLVAQVRGGYLNLRHLGILGADLAGGILSALGEAVGAQETNALHCLVLGLLAKDGQVSSTALALDSQRLVLLGRGRLNLKTEELDLAWRPLPKSGLTAAGGVGLSLGQLAKPFKITGTLASPRLSLDEAQVLATLGKTLGGFAALGPLGLAAGLASAGGVDSQLCQEALAAARKGVPYEPRSGLTQPLERLGESLGRSLQKLLPR